MNLDVTNADGKHYKIEFEQPVGCLVNPEGGLFVDACFHKEYLPRFPECHLCLSQHRHRPQPLSEYGSIMKNCVRKPGERGWHSVDPEYRTIKPKL